VLDVRGQGRRGAWWIKCIEGSLRVLKQGAVARQSTGQLAAASAFPQGAAGGSHMKKPKLMQELHGLGGEGWRQVRPDISALSLWA
jgi:hypothetical protein